MKKIVWITPEYFIETDIYVIPHLARYYNVTWFVLCQSGKEVPFKKEIDNIAENKNTKIIMKYEKGGLFSFSRFLYLWEMVSEIKKEKPSAIYSAILNVPFIPIVALRLSRKKVIFAAHNVNTPLGVKHYRLVKLYSDFTYSFFRNFQTFSKSQFSLLTGRFKNKNVFYAPFFLKNYGNPSRKENDIITFLFYGRIRQYKSPDVVIKASQIVAEKCKTPFKVIIAGECTDWYNYEKLITNKEIFDQRIYLIPNSDVPNLFAESHYTLLPYQDIAQSGSLFVGLTYEKPSILSDLPAFREVLTDGENCLFIKPADVDDLVCKMIYVIENHDNVYDKFRRNLRELKENYYSEEVIIQKYKNFIDSISYASVSDNK